MRVFLFVATITLFNINLTAQSKPTTAADYNGTFQYAVSETNAAFPFIFTVNVETFNRGKVVSTETEINERQADGVERIKTTIRKGGRTTVSHQISVGFGKVYCSHDGVKWKGPQEFECNGPSFLSGRKEPEKSEYSVEDKTVGGASVKIYREYVIFKPTGASRKKEFEETIATIDSQGFFISIVSNEGSLNPKTVTLVRKQSWDFKTPLKAVVAP